MSVATFCILYRQYEWEVFCARARGSSQQVSQWELVNSLLFYSTCMYKLPSRCPSPDPPHPVSQHIGNNCCGEKWPGPWGKHTTKHYAITSAWFNLCMPVLENRMYGKLLLVSNACNEDNEVSLPNPVGEKLYFHQLQVQCICNLGHFVVRSAT